MNADKLKELSELKDRRAKLIIEQKDLSLKVENLHTFLFLTGSEDLDQESRDLLVEQFVYMKHYLRILNKRIAVLNIEIKEYKK